jgi:hypothetical protein
MQQRRFAMKIPAGFAVIVLAASTTATAQPKQEESSGRVSLNDKGGPPLPRADKDGWLELATDTPVKHGKEFVVVDKDIGAIAKLRIDAEKGKVIVNRVKVYFADGTSKLYAPDKRLDPRHVASLIVDLGPRRTVDRVVITTETYTKGTYALYGSSSGGTLARR